MFFHKKVLSVLVSVSLIAGLMTGCGSAPKKADKTDSVQTNGNAPDYLNVTGYPIVKKPLTLNFVAASAANMVPFSEMYVFTEFEKKSGIHIEWNMLGESGVTEKRNLMLASNELPDAFYRSSLTAKDVVMYGSQGAFIPLQDLIAKYGANLSGRFKDLPDVKRAITAPDGNIYSIPAIYGYDAPRVNNFLWINTKWLANVGMSMPTTTEEYYNVLKAFKAKDANGNGKMDEVPFGGSTDRFLDMIIRGSWGLGANGKGDYQLDKDGKMSYINTDPRYREVLEYLNKLYTEGLIDKEIYTLNSQKGKAKAATGVFGSVYNNNPEVATVPDPTEWEGMPLLKGPHGDQVYAFAGGTMGELGTFVITSACKYPEAALHWVDFWYSDEGTELVHGGEKGKTYTFNVEGNMEYTDFVMKNPDGLSQDQVRGKYIPIPSCPRIFLEKFNPQALNAPRSKAARSKMLPYMPKETWNDFMYTAQEMDIMNTAGTDITNYFKEMQVKFITGAAPLSGWDDYVKQIKIMGLDKVLQVQQAAYDRYNKAK